MIPLFYIFRDGRELVNFPRSKNEYNKIENIMNFEDRADKKGGGRERVQTKIIWYIVLIGLEVF